MFVLCDSRLQPGYYQRYDVVGVDLTL